MAGLRSPGGTGLDRRAVRQAPFRPGAVIHGGAGMTEKMGCESNRAGGDAGAAARHDRLVEPDPGLVEQVLQLLGASDPAGLRVGDPVERQVAATRNMALAASRPGLRRGALEAAGGAGIYLTDAANVDAAATDIRSVAGAGRWDELGALVAPSVAEYIRKYGLYREANGTELSDAGIKETH